MVLREALDSAGTVHKDTRIGSDGNPSMPTKGINEV